MGVVNTIDYDHFPKQADENYKYPKLGKRVKVCYKYDNTRTHMGTIVRDDIEEPGETIIKLDNGRYIRAEECQYSILETMNDERKAIYEKIKDIFIEEAKVPLDMKKGKVLIIRAETLAYVAMFIKKLAELK